MMNQRWHSLILIGCLFSLAFTPTHQKWVKLGDRTVNHALDRDEIVVSAKKGVFRKIKLKVRRRKVIFRSVKVHFANGGVQNVNLRHEIPAGGETRNIDLEGKDRVIKKVVFWYNTTSAGGKRPIVQLWGER